MNYTAGIIAVLVLFIPLMIVLYTFHKRNREIDRKYEEEMKRIRKQYGVEL
jgi:TRAP-type C4-dicarboxylate transport system permease large subunit